MIRINKDNLTGNIVLNNGKFGCTFFLGHMFPVFFTDADGNAAGSTQWQDNMSAGEEVYSLNEERWAEFKVIKENAEEFIIETKGVFCGGNDQYFLKEFQEVSAVYTWKFTDKSSSIGLDIVIDGKSELTADFLLNAPGMRFQEQKNILETSAVNGKYEGGKICFGAAIEVKI